MNQQKVQLKVFYLAEMLAANLALLNHPQLDDALAEMTEHLKAALMEIHLADSKADLMDHQMENYSVVQMEFHLVVLTVEMTENPKAALMDFC